MTVDYLIIGQGICGTWLSYYLVKAGKKVMVIDGAMPNTATRSASGVINPVTGRQVVNTWMADELLPFADKAYSLLGIELSETLIEQKNIIAFPPSLQMKEAYDKKMEEEDGYILPVGEGGNQHKQWFNYIFEAVTIAPVYLINLLPLLKGWRNKLEEQNSLLPEFFEEDRLICKDDHIEYKNINAQKIIYCNGVETAKSVYWKNLPFIANKGQVLLAAIPALPATHIYKFGNLTMVPWYDNLWWVGSSYENDYDTTEPTEIFKEQAITSLNNILKIPFSVKDHIASLRPAVLAERRPFVGIHSLYACIGIFNGMGSKGCSLAPWFANELCDHLIHGKTIDPLADVKRFSRILSR